MLPSLPQLLLVLAVVVLFFGRGRIAAVMGDFGSGIKAFRHGLKDEELDSSPQSIRHRETD